jgi:EmrB/QacA subfamily drug resistance transporter
MSRRWWTLVAIGLATFMTYLDNNVTNVALPTIERSLHLSVAGLEWVVSSYLLTLGGLLLAGGRLADVYGRRLMFQVGLVVFTVSSLVAGLAGNGGVLVVSRAVQGAGAAMLMPTTLAIITATFPDVKERARAIAFWSASSAVGLGCGPVAGGLISQHLRWGWIFFINVPVGAVTFAIAALSMHESREKSAVRRLDLPGLIAISVTLFALTYALIDGNDKGWTAAVITLTLALAVVSLAAFLVIEARSSHPMVALTMFKTREFSGGSGAMMIWAFGVLGIYFYTSIYLQDLLRFSPTRAGLAFVPMALCLAAGASISPRVAAAIGAHRTVPLGMLLMTTGLCTFTLLGLREGYGNLMPGFIAFGLGAGLMGVPLVGAIMAATSASRAGITSAMLNDSREVAALLGITVIGAVLRTRQSAALRSGASHSQAYLDGFHAGLYVTISLMVLGIVVSFVTLRPRVSSAAGALTAASEESAADVPQSTS